MSLRPSVQGRTSEAITKLLALAPSPTAAVCEELADLTQSTGRADCCAQGRTSEAITKLLALAPDTATVVTLDDEGGVASSEEVPCALVHRGDVLKVGARQSTASSELCAVCGLRLARTTS